LSRNRLDSLLFITPIFLKVIFIFILPILRANNFGYAGRSLDKIPKMPFFIRTINLSAIRVADDNGVVSPRTSGGGNKALRRRRTAGGCRSGSRRCGGFINSYQTMRASIFI
jgi:hypothetical protein